MNRPRVTIDQIKAKTRFSLVGGPFGSNLVTSDYQEYGVPVIRGGNIPGDKAFSYDDLVFVSEEKADRLLPNNAFPGDLVVTQRGTLGQVGLIPSDSPYPRFVISQSQMKLTVDPQIASAKFVYYYFCLPESVQRVKNQAITSGVPHINLEILKRFELTLPPLQEQRRIAAVLSAYDDLIENNQRRIQLLEQAARLIYREWFVRLRFPGHERVRVVDGVPEEWEQKHLDRVADVNQQQLKGSHQGIIEYVDISSVSPGSIDATQTVEFEMAPGRARRVVRHGDVIWSCVRPNRRSHAIIWNPRPNLIVSTGFAVITPRQVPTSYLYYALTTDAFVSYLTNRARGGAYPAVLASDFEDAELLIPPETLIGEFNSLVRPMIDQRANLQLQNERLRIARDLLLPRLMSGQIEV